MEPRPLSKQNCEQVSRQNSVHVVEDMMTRNINEQATLLALKHWLNYNPPPIEVEEYLCQLLAFKQR